jgi:hypothetical protein
MAQTRAIRRFMLTLDTISEAFNYADGGPAGPELARVLRQIAADVERVTDDEQLLRTRQVEDRDGEAIGTYRMMFQ